MLMPPLIASSIKMTLKWLLNSFSGAALLILILAPFYIRGLPDLETWHTEILESEYRENSVTQSFEEYLNLEERLFAELEKKIVQPLTDKPPLNRFYKGSAAYPDSFDINWNRSFLLPAASPSAGVLLLHGMSDSPYSLRTIGDGLNKKGALVLGLRLPGHGTAPSGLIEVRYEDMAGAVRLAMAELAARAKGKPLYIIGYSNGAALGLNYALSSLDDPSLKPLSGLILISPAIGVSKIAALAKLMETLSKVPGCEKLAWNSIIPEYNPYKYGSFATNAGDQVHRLTKKINRGMIEANKTGKSHRIPNILAFQSIADATVSTSALVKDLFNKLPAAGHELVIFDINHTFDLKSLIRKGPIPELETLFNRPSLNYTISFISNRNNSDSQVYLRRKSAGQASESQIPLEMAWPKGLYSLSHIALGFPISDPLYGTDEGARTEGLTLGDIQLRGEKGILKMPAEEMMRLKYNPFYDLVEDKITRMIFPL